jgi:hypothetical protein
MVTQNVDKDLVLKMIREGASSQKISEALAREGFHLTAAGVRAVKRRAGLSGGRLIYAEVFPWEGMGERDFQTYDAAMLRCIARLGRGEVLPETLKIKVDSWRNARDKANDGLGEVIWFDPDGWTYLNREPEDAPGSYIRTPQAMDQIRKRLRRERGEH